MATIDVTVCDDLKAFVEVEARGGGYANSSEYVHDVLLTLWRHKTKAALESALIRRIDGAPAIELPPQFWNELKARVRQRGSAAPLSFAPFSGA